ncbi:MAG TPA: ABC transporter ATP-binding protein [Chthoniobacterales bacterium]|nr:ABC transporter ATP-binding protein [Chthoniobacterales bacterium]
MTEPAVRVTKVSKVFPVPFSRRAIVALRDLTLSISRGEVYGLLGPNGSGKSTTLKIILGLVSPSRGQAEIFGRDSSRVTSRESIGFLPESPYFYKYLTGRETLRFYGRLCGVDRERLPRRIEELLELVGLTGAADRRLSGYSKGMLQRIGLAQALVNEPRLLVLDEPTAGVDPAGSRDIRDLIVRLRQRGVTVLLSSHLLEQMQEVCDRVGILANGVLVREGRIDELLGVENQTEVVLENAPAELLGRIAALAAASGARVVDQRKPQTTLERLFLDATDTRRGQTDKAEHPA